MFPLDRVAACENALSAVSGACAAMRALNDLRRAAGKEALGFGVGVNIGEVMYGNIGTSARLDFTVIGPAVNAAARLEALTKDVGVCALFSEAFAEKVHPNPSSRKDDIAFAASESRLKSSHLRIRNDRAA